VAVPLILARSFKDAHAFANDELGLSNGYYRVVNSAGTIKACRNVDIFLVPGWDKRPDRFTMKSALKWCRLNIRDVATERESAAAFDAAMPPAPVDTSVHLVLDLAFVHEVADPSVIQTTKDPSEVTCEQCLQVITEMQEGNDTRYPNDERTHRIALRYNSLQDATRERTFDLEEPAADAPEPAEDEIVVTTGPSAAPVEAEPTPEPEAPKPKARRRTKCKQCEQLHYKGDPCIESEDS